MQPGGVPSWGKVSNLHRYQWHHVVMTRNSSNSIQIYVNGNLSQYYVSNSGAQSRTYYTLVEIQIRVNTLMGVWMK